MGLVAILNDLHKGRDSGNRESSSISPRSHILVSLTGLILIFFPSSGGHRGSRCSRPAGALLSGVCDLGSVTQPDAPALLLAPCSSSRQTQGKRFSRERLLSNSRREINRGSHASESEGRR